MLLKPAKPGASVNVLHNRHSTLLFALQDFSTLANSALHTQVASALGTNGIHELLDTLYLSRPALTGHNSAPSGWSRSACYYSSIQTLKEVQR